MTVSFRDSDGTTRLSGDLLATGGATGDVLTQQADGTYEPAPGGSLPDPITTPLNVELAADAVGLSVTAASGGSAHVADFIPDNPDQTVSIDSFGRFVSQAFQFLGLVASGRFAVSLPGTCLFTVEDDDTGDAIIKAVAGATDKIGFFNTAPAAQPGAIANAAGGVVVDDEARAALNSLLAAARTLGLIDT